MEVGRSEAYIFECYSGSEGENVREFPVDDGRESVATRSLPDEDVAALEVTVAENCAAVYYPSMCGGKPCMAACW
jgi:hypothetical protein